MVNLSPLLKVSDRQAFDNVLSKAAEAFKEWRTWPAPKRGDVVRQIGEALRKYKEPLGKLVVTRWAKACRKVMAKYRK